MDHDVKPLYLFYQSNVVTLFLQDEAENGSPIEDDKNRGMFDQEEYSCSDSEEEEEEVQYGARRRKPDRGAQKANKYSLCTNCLLMSLIVCFQGCIMEIKFKEEAKC